MPHPCLCCGACCAYFRVAFYWTEADPALGGHVPAEATTQLDPHRLAMKGTEGGKPRCTALEGEVGVATTCRMYERRPSPCHELKPAFENGEPSPQCDRARIAYGLRPLTRDAWEHPPATAA